MHIIAAGLVARKSEGTRTRLGIGIPKAGSRICVPSAMDLPVRASRRDASGRHHHQRDRSKHALPPVAVVDPLGRPWPPAMSSAADSRIAAIWLGCQGLALSQFGQEGRWPRLRARARGFVIGRRGGRPCFARARASAARRRRAARARPAAGQARRGRPCRAGPKRCPCGPRGSAIMRSILSRRRFRARPSAGRRSPERPGLGHPLSP